jgi:hypothetical protein
MMGCHGDDQVLGNRSGEGGGAALAATYRASIGSQQAELPIVALDGERAIALMMTIDLGVRFTAVAAFAQDTVRVCLSSLRESWTLAGSRSSIDRGIGCICRVYGGGFG